jgi:mono/diheme cytochrome c family protein
MRSRLIFCFALVASPMAAQNLDEGAAAFANHCAGCHGAEAKGDGPMASLLRVPPADLTALSATNDGAFPLARVIARIDGTTEVAAHGDPMPVFGMLLQGPSVATVAPDGREVVAAEEIVSIAEWLATQQR